jgi:hypothetical protein
MGSSIRFSCIPISVPVCRRPSEISVTDSYEMVEWVTNSFSTAIQWETDTTSNTVYHKVQSSTPTSVFSDVAEDSVAYYAISSVSRYPFLAASFI